MQEMYEKSMQMIKNLNVKSEKAYKLLLKDYLLLSSESLKYICQTKSFYDVIERAKGS
jgi:hypothetical protein